VHSAESGVMPGRRSAPVRHPRAPDGYDPPPAKREWIM